MTLSALASTFLLVITLGYTLLCWASPFGRCRKCHGLGFKLTHTRRGKPKRGKTCRRCRGAGMRIRRGRHLFNSAQSIQRAGTDQRQPIPGGKP